VPVFDERREFQIGVKCAPSSAAIDICGRRAATNFLDLEVPLDAAAAMLRL
jgi:hypothetical protein